MYANSIAQTDGMKPRFPEYISGGAVDGVCRSSYINSQMLWSTVQIYLSAYLFVGLAGRVSALGKKVRELREPNAGGPLLVKDLGIGIE